ncbi:MAG TPA: hypothetical protein VJ935_10945 [Acidimicrobiia bacterium]|nr:hypothetical protein [Acidimicrobiia bacterium]
MLLSRPKAYGSRALRSGINGKPLLGILRLRAILVGTGGGVLGSGLTFALGAFAARVTGSETIAGIALTVSVLVGFGLGGYVAGRMALINGRFHGSITALIVAAIVIAVAALGGSRAPLGSVLLLALIAIVGGGIGGSLGGRRPPVTE